MVRFTVFDCVIIGAGPAGLSASLILGRSRRNIALFDNRTNRNLGDMLDEAVQRIQPGDKIILHSVQGWH
ncbi:hypothetical protein A8F95_21110 [Bacillus wudalianchiensis]|uniref:FAD/NAD(P)-binding domain-containing protein n=1 Tax=Pseudobacillus wudalianchiensis TaxID=1743143 RepID=A0A1B9B2C8_9BACI|nr:hypothetical protein A8F95_21110 [Bacillus wudalianchiensis]